MFTYGGFGRPILSLQRRKGNNKPRDASTPSGSTAAESVRNLIKKNPKYSKRINYNALKDLFTDDGSTFQMAAGDDDKEDDEDTQLYTMDDKSDGEGMLIVEEAGGGGVGQSRPAKSRSTSLVPNIGAASSGVGMAVGAGDADGDDEEDAEGEEDVEEDADKEEPYAEWDAYEQEV